MKPEEREAFFKQKRAEKSAEIKKKNLEERKKREELQKLRSRVFCIRNLLDSLSSWNPFRIL